MMSAAFGSKVMISLNSTFGELKMIIKARFAVKQWQIKIACSGDEKKLISKHDFRFKHAQKQVLLWNEGTKIMSLFESALARYWVDVG